MFLSTFQDFTKDSTYFAYCILFIVWKYAILGGPMTCLIYYCMNFNTLKFIL